jgi:hypothetical protein
VRDNGSISLPGNLHTGYITVLEPATGLPGRSGKGGEATEVT